MKRYYYMDVLNIIATIAVVFLHSSEYAFTNAQNNHWLLAVIIQCAFIWAVPIFFMLSGANILDYRGRENTQQFFKRRFKRVVVPFMVWSIIWFLITFPRYSVFSLKTYGVLFDGLMHDTIQPFLWFFYFIIGFYLSAPLLSRITTTDNRQSVLYLMGLNLVFVGLISYGLHLWQKPDTLFTSTISIGVSGGVGYFVLGWYLKHYPLSTAKVRWILIIGVLSLLMMIGLTVYLSAKRGVFQREVYDIWGIFGLVWATSIFVLVQHRLGNWMPSPKCQKYLKSLASTSLGVYVIHEWLIENIERFGHVHSNSLIYMLLMPILVWIVSVVIVKIIQAIPMIKQIV